MRIEPRSFVLVCVLIGGMGQGVIAPRLPELLGDTEDLALYSGLAASLMYLGMFLSTFRFGRMADEGRAHWLLGPGLVLYALTLLALGWFHHPIAIFSSRLVEGVALAAIFVSADFILGRLSKESERGKWLAFYGVVLSVGLILGPFVSMVSSYAAPKGEVSDSMAVAGSLSFLAFIAFLLGIFAWRIRVAAAEPAPAGKEGLCLGALTTAVAYGFLEAGLVSIFPVLALAGGPLDAESILILVVIVAGAGAIIWGAMADTWHPRKVAIVLFFFLIVCTALSAVGTLLHPSPYWIIVYCGVFGFLGGGISPVGFSWLLAETPSDQFGRASGAYLRWYGIGSLVGPAATGAGLQYGQSLGMLAVISLMAVVSLACLGLFSSTGNAEGFK